LIVKADDLGVALAANTSKSAAGAVARAIGRGLVGGMPAFLKVLGIVGTAAMIWVGGGIIVHGLEEYGFATLGHLIHHAAEIAAAAFPLAGLTEWLVTAAGSGLVGLLVGAALIPITGFILAPAWRSVTRLRTA
jgi:uncharacterized protein